MPDSLQSIQTTMPASAAHAAEPPQVVAPSAATGILRPGDNCWCTAHASRVAVLIDGEAYYSAVRRAIAAAQRRIFILAWDVDSRIRLVPGGANDGLPEPLGDFLNAVVARRKGLRAYVLSWDFAMIYALEREWLPQYKLDWRTHRRLKFRLDARHPVGASHHQKVVVIDDTVAFIGGMDMARSRWDRSEHAPNDPLRHDADGKPYGPHHDVQALVDGEAAYRLGLLARERWYRATGQRLPAAASPHAARAVAQAIDDPWPASVEPDFTDLQVGIARTEPALDGHAAVTELRQLHCDAIAAAKRHMFFENQYFTSSVIGDALCARLQEPAGPEVVVASSPAQSGWLEQATMGVLRARLHARLERADAHGRYRFYCPQIPDLHPKCLNIHSKVMTIDDELLCVGSANLSNRSMSLDTECNLVIEARGDASIAAGIAHVRHRLLGEHLGVTADRVAASEREHGSLVRAIEALRRPGRTLEPFEPVIQADLDALIPIESVADPENPIDAAELIQQLVPEPVPPPPPAHRFARLGVVAGVLAALAAAWMWTPLGDYLNVQTMTEVAHRMDDAPFTPLIMIATYVLAGFLVVPVVLLITVTAIAFDPVPGTLYAVSGTMASAAASYALGHGLGRATVRRLAGERINNLSRRIAKRGIVAVALVRMLPVAPFTLVNMVAGASHIRLRDFLIGTFIGMTPGIVMIVLVTNQLVEAVRRPGWATFGALAAVLGLLLGMSMLTRRLQRRTDGDTDEQRQA